MMTVCPISFWHQRTPNAIAIRSNKQNLTYSDLDKLICHMCGFLSEMPNSPLAFPAEISVHAVALLFAAFRMQSCIFPFHPKLLENQVNHFPAKILDPKKIPLGNSLINPSLNLNAIVTAISTSGSTGKSKIALHTINNHLTSAQSAIQALHLYSGDAYLLNLPLYHVSGMAICWRTFLAGATLLMPDSEEHATHLSMVPTQLYRMLENRIIFPHLKCLLLGSAPLSPLLYRQAKHLPLYMSYGMTETSSMIALKIPDGHPMIAGKPLPHVEIKIATDQEIIVRGSSLFHGYFGEEPLERNAWFSTKDLGRWNIHEHLEILGRKDRQFISGGENIQPEEIEQALLSHPEVIEAYIESVEDNEYGHRPKAHLFCRKTLTEKQLSIHLEKILLPYKIPKMFVFHSTPLKRTKSLQ